jgi:DNA polymerase V
MVMNLQREDARQLNLFGEGEGGPTILDRNRRLMEAVDELNRRLGKGTIRIGAAGTEGNWGMRRGKLSRRFTTRWEELLQI